MARKKPTYESILRKFKKVVRDLEQIIRDTNYWNGLPQAEGHPIDCEDIRIAVHHAKRTVSLWEKKECESAWKEWKNVEEALVQYQD